MTLLLYLLKPLYLNPHVFVTFAIPILSPILLQQGAVSRQLVVLSCLSG